MLFRGGLNIYGYSEGDPVNRVDPRGLCSCLSEGVDFLVSFAFDALGVKGIGALGRMVRANRLFSFSNAYYRGAVQLLRGGDEIPAALWRDTGRYLYEVARLERQLAVRDALTGALAKTYDAISTDPSNLKDWAKLVPVIGSGLEFGELINCVW